MTFNDHVYGSFTIEEPVLVELIMSPAMQRLKEINQLGLPDRMFHKPGFKRFGHSVGVAELLKRLGATVEEQVAGLLHDVSHTAFSHLTDWIYRNNTAEDGQDKGHEDYIRSTDIPSILEKHGLPIERIVNPTLFGLLERDAPDLCADRVDYAMRESEPVIADACASHVIAHNGIMAFDDIAAARTFADQFLYLQDTCWGSFEAASRYRIMGDALRIAIEVSIVTKEDLWDTDEEVLSLLRNSQNAPINTLLNTLEQPSLEHLPRAKEPTIKKFRHVDPYVLVNDSLHRLSKIDPTFAQKLDQARQNNQAGHHIVDAKAII